MELDKKTLEYFRAQGRRGGKKLLRLKGKKHFKEMGKKSALLKSEQQKLSTAPLFDN